MRNDWPEGLEEAILPLWDETHGDRQTELVVIGRHMDRTSVEAALKSCLLSEKEFASVKSDDLDEVIFHYRGQRGRT